MINQQAIASESRATTQRRCYYFFHLPKTGGRSIEMVLRHKFGNSVVSPRKNKKFTTDFVAVRKFRSIAPKPGCHFVGHYASWSLIEDHSAEYVKACFWRHPADWVVSLYNYRLHRNQHRLHRLFKLEDFRKSMLRNPMTEHLLLYCGDVRGFRYFFMSDARKFKHAADLVCKFDWFADISQVDAFLDCIGTEGVVDLRRSNRIPEHLKRLNNLPMAMREDIERTNPVDLLLHQLALTSDRERVMYEASLILNQRFAALDLLRLVALPYYRWKTWVLPFLPSSLVSVPSSTSASRARGPHQPDRDLTIGSGPSQCSPTPSPIELLDNKRVR